jgi:hypothetical protein
MFDRTDAAFAFKLERAIVKILSGDENTPGLFRTLLTAQNWESVLITKGQIQAYENLLDHVMKDVVTSMNGEKQARHQADRSVN